jgi:hypothetical protein
MWANKLEKEGVFEIEEPVEQLNVGIEKMLELVNEQRDMVLLMYTESKSLPKYFLKIILENESRLIECFEKILKRGSENGVFQAKDPFIIANIIVYLLSLEPLRGWNLRKNFKVEEINKHIKEYILGSILNLPPK